MKKSLLSGWILALFFGMVMPLSASDYYDKLKYVDFKQLLPEDSMEMGTETGGGRPPAILTDEAGEEIEKPSKNQLLEPSIIENQYRNAYGSELARSLVQYGYDIFTTAGPKSSGLAVPDTNYILGTGDTLLVRAWGRSTDMEYSAVVDREGYIRIPKLGPISVAGVKYGRVESIVRKEAKKYIQGMNISITLINLRSLEVYVVGEVYHPGLHVVPSFSTIFDGLLFAGGIKKSGTLRQVRLFRNDVEIQQFDLYDLLLTGSRKSDLALQNKDVIYVGEIGKTAAVAGAANVPAIFEISSEKTLRDLVGLAGGILPQGFGGRVYLRRFSQNRDFSIEDIEVVDFPGILDTQKVMNGDLLNLEFMNSSRPTPSVVRLSGNVWRPDVFKFKKGLKLSDILISTELLKPDSVMSFGFIHRYNQNLTRSRTMRFPLQQVLSGAYDDLLEPYDQIEILSRKDLGITEEFHISGAVWKPGVFSYQPGLRLIDAIALAGGLKFGAGENRIEVARQVIRGDQVETDYVLLDLSKHGEIVLQPNDAILIPEMKDAAVVNKIKISGEVKFPGTYTIGKDERLSDLIDRAGGFTNEAYLFGARYTSVNAREIQQKSIDVMIEQLQLSYLQNVTEDSQISVSGDEAKTIQAADLAMNRFFARLKAIRAEGRIAIRIEEMGSFRGSSYDFIPQNGDTLNIPRKPSFVSVVGSVYSPGSYLYKPKMRLKYYLKKSGGFYKTADEEYIYLLKANGEIISAPQRNGVFTSMKRTVIMPGDTIVVPEKLDRIPYLRRLRDVTDIIFKIATTAGIAFAI